MTLSDLAARWRLHKDTARKGTLEPGFPGALALSRKTLRRSAAEVADWAAERRATKAPQPVPRALRRRANRATIAALPAPARVS